MKTHLDGERVLGGEPLLGPEQAIHGSSWGQMHGGYFSDPEVARPLVAAVRGVWAEARPDRIVDLGGGTGYLLAQLRATGVAGDCMTVVDESAPQLAEAEKAGLACVRGSVNSFRRAEVAPPGVRILWLMRSVLHYAGESGLDPLLRHLRAQAEPGEAWVHQTACFERAEDAACLNALYRRMQTAKWYPTVADLQVRLASAGWRTEAVRPAPPLHLDSGELGRRYDLDAADLASIRTEMGREFGGPNPVFRDWPDGFRAELRYAVFSCRAI
jgi:hypothetical protein